MKPAKYRKIAKALDKLGSASRPGKGDHEVWICPCGRHRTVLVKDTEITAGVLRSARKDLECIQSERWWEP